MARSMADDYQDTYRARIEYQHRQYNPDYDWSKPETRFSEPKEDAQTFVKCYGPYANEGTAKQQLSREARGVSIKVLSAKVQKASIVWEDVDD